jgi:hypothetical protein
MNISNLLFFDKNGESYNLSLNADGYWEGADYFLPISTEIFDNSNIFILEKVTQSGSTSYKFPQMDPGSKFEVVWKSSKFKSNFFLFTINFEGSGVDAIPYINKQEGLDINYSDFGQSLGTLDLSYPMQLNIAFAPTEERSYSRVMQLYYTQGSTRTLVLEMTFYGEGEGEDERFRVWLENFGIKFNREDALLLKEYDLKESLTDWAKVNEARKNLLVNQDQVYPYVGTYKGMLNLVNLLGFRDVLRVKEYWKNIDTTSPYFRKFAMVDITDLMLVGDVNKVGLVDERGGIQKGQSFKKTEFLALAYQFTVASDTYDDDGLPLIEETTEFSVDEIFFKLHGVAKKLENEILPVNVVIRDIIGEFIYFNKFNLRNWLDEATIESIQINDVYKVQVLEPNLNAVELKIRDIKTLYPKLNGVSQFPEFTYNYGPVEPYENGQFYVPSQIPVLISAISDYYEALTNFEFWEEGTSPTNFGDDTSTKIGCPIVLEAYIPDFTLRDLDGVSFDDFITVAPTTSSSSHNVSTGLKTFSVVGAEALSVGASVKIYVTTDQSQYLIGSVTQITDQDVQIDISSAVGTATSNTSWTIYVMDTQHTIANLKYRTGYEIEWVIEGPRDYLFKRRGKIMDLVKIAHILPHTGNYTITSYIHDLQSGVSFDRISLTVKTEEPALQVFTKLQDKSKYTFESLSELMIEDLGQSPLYDPIVNIINPNGFNQPITEIDSNYLDWYAYSGYWGVGGKLDEALLYYEGEGYQPFAKSNHPNRLNWGTGSIKNQPTIQDYGASKLGELYSQDFSDMSYVGDSIAGFNLTLKSNNPSTPGAFLHTLQFGGFPDLVISEILPNASLSSLANYLNTTSLPGWSNFYFKVVNDTVVANALSQSRENHSIITALHRATVYDSVGGVSYPIDESGVTISDSTISDSGLYVFTELYFGPTTNETSGLQIGTKVRVMNSFGGYIDGVITELSNEQFSVQAYGSNQIGSLSSFSIYWLDTIYTFSRPGTAFQSSTIDAVQATLAIHDLALDDDLLFLYSGFEDKLKLISNSRPAPASRIQYWINRGMVSYDNLPNDLYLESTQIDLGITGTNDLAFPLTSGTDTLRHRSNSVNGWTLSQDFYIKIDDSDQSWQTNKEVKILFDSPIYAGNWTIRIVTDSQNSLGSGVYGKVIATLTKSDFPRAEGLPSKKAISITCTNATSLNFTVDKINPIQIGYLPSYYDQNSFNVSNIKTTYDTITVPMRHPVFVVISNLASNVQTEWILTDVNDVEIIKVSSPAYFVWRFDKAGGYKLRVKSVDTRNNEYVLDKSISIASVLEPREYFRLIDMELKDRRLLLADL